MTSKKTLSRMLASCALAAVVLLAAAPAAAQVDFSNIVVIGASGDSGFLDNCWVKHGQVDSWPAIFARQAGATSFEQPIINEPGLGGCMVLTSLAPSFSNQPSTGTPANLTLPRPYNNLAIPGYLTASVVTCTTNTGQTPCNNALIDVVLRHSGATVLQQAASVHPTFVIVGILANEALGPGTSGTVIDNVTLISAATYAGFYKTILDTMKAAQGGTGKGLVATVLDVTSLPYFTTVKPLLGVAPNGQPIYVLGPTGCPTGVPACPVPAGTIVPLPLAQLMKAGYGVPCAVNPNLPKCNTPLPDNATMIGTSAVPGLLYPSEVNLLRTRTAEYNAQIKAIAAADGYAVLDTAALMIDVATNGREYAGMQLTASYLTGGVFSYDGVHPNSIGDALVADEAVQVVNAAYGTHIPRVNLHDYLFNGNSTGGFPAGMRLSPDEVLDWAAAFFTPENYVEFSAVMPTVRVPVAPGNDPGAPQWKPGRRFDAN